MRATSWVLVILLSGTVWAVCLPDSFESDSVCQSSAILLGGQTQARNFCDNPEVWARFNACAGRPYTIETSALGPAADTRIELYDGDCATLLASDDDSGGGKASRLNWTAPHDGVYELRIVQADGTSGDDRDYLLAILGDTSSCSSWQVAYPRAQAANALRQLPDGGFLGAGWAWGQGGGGEHDVWLVRTDVHGRPLWQRIYGSSTKTEEARDLAPTPDGGFLVAGVESEPSGASPDGFLAKFDAGGNLLWANSFGTDDWDELNSLAVTPDGGAVAVGYIHRQGASAEAWAVRVDSAGGLMWSRDYSKASLYFDEVLAVEDGYVVAATLSPRSAGCPGLVKLDGAGRPVWATAYENLASYARGHTLAIGRDGSFLLGGYHTIRVGYMGFLLRADASRQPLWARELGYWVEMAECSVTGVTALAGGGWGVASSYYDATALEIADDGTVVWSGSETNAPGAVIATADGGFALVRGTSLIKTSAGSTCPAWNTTSVSTTTMRPVASELSLSSRSLSITVTANVSFGPVAEPNETLDECRACTAPTSASVIHLNRDTAGVRLAWTAGGAPLYDLVRGDLGALWQTSGDFAAALDSAGGACLVNDAGSPEFVDAEAGPDSGDGRFYLVRGVTADCPASGSYDSGADQVGSRDPEITASSNSCP